jgi:PAS domain S-box-containing protein
VKAKKQRTTTVARRTLDALRNVYALLLHDPHDPDILSLLLSEAMAVLESPIGLMGNVRTMGGAHYLVVQELKELIEESDVRELRRLPVREALPLDGSLPFLNACLFKHQIVVDAATHHFSTLAGLLELSAPLERLICIPVLGDGRSDGMLLLANRSGGYQLQDARACDLVLQTYSDVLQARQQEKKRQKEFRLLRDEQRRLQSFLDDSSDLILSLDSRGRFQYVNPVWCTTMGYTLDEVREKTIQDVVREDFRGELFSIIDRLLKERTPVFTQIIFYSRHGREIITEGSFSFHIDKGTTMALRGIFRNITEKKKAEDELRGSEERFRTQFENALGIMATHDTEGHLLSINASAAKILGYELHELSGKKLIDFIPNRYMNLLNLYLNRIAQKGHDEGIMRVRRRDGEERVWVYNNARVEMADGRSVVIANAADITERVEMEEKLKQARNLAERNSKMKDTFLANISHEIRTPMNAILGFSELLKKRVQDPESQHYLSSILLGGRNLLSLINDILDLSKIEAGMLRIEPEPVLIRRFAKEIQDIFLPATTEKGITLTLEIEDAVADYLILDELRVRQVLFNLVGNAVKFTHQGSVGIRIFQIPVASSDKQVNLTIEVHDTGIGIPIDQQARIFDAFRQQEEQQQKQYGGTGLGLTISRRLAEMMNGAIHLESTPGKGSVFRLQIENVGVGEMDEPGQHEIPEEVVVFTGQTILIVEDIASNRAVLRGLLEPAGLHVIEAENGKKGLDVFFRHQPDLVIMDLMMPEMDGVETAQTIRKREKEKRTPIILLTAAMDTTVEKLDFDAFLLKPVTSAQLFPILKKLLQKEEKNKKEKSGLGKRVLLIDDDPLFRNMLKALLEEQFTVDVDIVAGDQDVLPTIRCNYYALVLVDYHLSWKLNEREWSQHLRKAMDTGTQIVLVSGEEEDVLTAAQKKYGFDAVLRKPVLSADLDRVITPLLNHKEETMKSNAHHLGGISPRLYYDISKATAIAGNKPNVLQQWLKEFVSNLEKAEDTIGQFSESGRAHRSDRSIHNLIGLSSYFGADHLKEQLRNVNAQINRQTSENSPECSVDATLNALLRDVKKELQLVLEGVKAHIE